MEKFNERLAAAMKVRHMNSSELSRCSGINIGTISHYMNGGYKAKQDKVYKLAKALNVSPTWLLGFDVDMEADPSPISKSEETELVRAYSKADEKTKRIIRQLLDLEG